MTVGAAPSGRQLRREKSKRKKSLKGNKNDILLIVNTVSLGKMEKYLGWILSGQLTLNNKKKQDWNRYSF